MAWWLLASYVISLVVYWIGALLEASVILGILLIVVLIVAIVFLGYYVAKKRKAQVA